MRDCNAMYSFVAGQTSCQNEIEQQLSSRPSVCKKIFQYINVLMARIHAIVFAGMEYLHQQKYIHRDLKSSNGKPGRDMDAVDFHFSKASILAI